MLDSVIENGATGIGRVFDQTRRIKRRKTKMIACMFPGQGSQARGMGQGLFDSVPEYCSIEREVDQLLGYSLRRLCLEDNNNQLKDTQYTQPCLFVVNALHYYKSLSEGLKPRYVAGHSLGEYNALLAAGCFDLLTGLRLVKKRGELMAQVKNGGMTAVIGLNVDRITQVLRDGNLVTIDVANFNSPTQIVISGPVDDLKRAATVLEKVGAQMCIPLPVSAAFHSRYMNTAAKSFHEFLAPFTFSAPKIPVVSNVTALLYPSIDASSQIKSLLAKQITHSVQWVQAVRYLLQQGVSEFKELGPGSVLSRLVEQIKQDNVTNTRNTTRIGS